MQSKTIGLKEFRSQLPAIKRKIKREGWVYVVTERNMPIFQIQSVAAVVPEQEAQKIASVSLASMLKDLNFHSGHRDSSRRVDEIAYGA